MGRVIDYTESSEFYEDDYLLVDNPTIGTKKVRAANVINKPISVDSTLTRNGQAADAAVVGNALSGLDDRLSSVETTDVTLTHEGQAADAKAVGDAIENIESTIESVPSNVRLAIYSLLAKAEYTEASVNNDLAIVRTWANVDGNDSDLVDSGITDSMILRS